MLTIRDKNCLKKIQPEFPLTQRPFAHLASQAGLSEQAMIRFFRKLQREKVLRYIAPMFDMRELGIVSSLVAMRVPANKLNKTVKLINAYPNVSHNYLRDDEYNVWFTVSAASARRHQAIIREIKKKTGIHDILDLKTRKIFKTRAVFEL